MFKRPVASARGAFIVLSILMFFFSAQVSLTIYVDSSFLKDTIAHTPSLMTMGIWGDPEDMVGAVYTFASLITILGLLYAPRILRRVGNYRWTLGLFMLQTLLLLSLALVRNGWLIIPIFVVESALVSILYFNFDIFLERYSSDEHTGVIRGLFITISSIAWLLPPMIAGNIIDNSGYGLVYLSAAVILLPIILLLRYSMSNFQDLSYKDVPLLPSPDIIAANPNVWRGMACGFFLQFFYAWMIIYTPLLLHDHLAFSWSEIGFMLTLALTAFVIFPSPMGWLADKVMGEKELLILGFLFMGVASFMIPSLVSKGASFTMWVIVLFVGRTGASTVEAMTEAYFFKQIDGHDAGLIGYFRRMRPLAFIAAPLLASFLLQFSWFTLTDLFSALGIVMFLAIYFPLRLKDTL
jgi:MFS family permease